MSRILDWLDHRTGYRHLLAEALYENIPGGARWRYVWGSTLVYTFVVQVLTGIFLWMFYSPSSQTAWESVYYLQEQVPGGWLLRGIHHYTAQAMVVLLALHLTQVVIDGAYKAPREINFWLGLVLMLLVLGLALTGYLLPWDQKGFWATTVATRIAGLTPPAGPSLEKLIVGGPSYGHYTLTRFFALHAGVLPGLLVLVLVVHIMLFRRHGIMARIAPKRPRPDQFFWPEQALRDAVACLAIAAVVLLLTIYRRPELGAPADEAVIYSIPRPEWYFLFLFQMLKFFPGKYEALGAIVVPGLVMFLLFLMPVVGRRRAGHVFNVALVFLLLAGAAGLTASALHEDYQARWFPNRDFTDVKKVLDEVAIDLRKNGPESKYRGVKDDKKKWSVYFNGDADKIAVFEKRYAEYQAQSKSPGDGKVTGNHKFADVQKVLDGIATDLHDRGLMSKYRGILEDKHKWEVYFDKDATKVAAFEKRLADYQAYTKWRKYLEAVEAANVEATRARELAAPPRGIPPEGAQSLVRNDPKIQGPLLFQRHCAACHDCADAQGKGISSLRPLEYVRDKDGHVTQERKQIPNGAPNLYGFGSRQWLAGLLDPKKIAQVKYDEATAQVLDAPYFGNTSHRNGDMTAAVKERFTKLDASGRANFKKLVAALSSEAGLKSQKKEDEQLAQEAIAALPPKASAADRDKAVIASRSGALAAFTCMECHKFHSEGELGDAPDLTGYGSRKWMLDFISNPSHARFYSGKKNDRMPAFAANAEDPLLKQREIEQIVDWLRGDWYEPLEKNDPMTKPQ